MSSEEGQQSRDEEGLLLEYDVIICGTGLVQSILAAALARAGKSVLHCDGDDSYGELDAVWNFSKLDDEQRLQKAQHLQGLQRQQPCPSTGNVDIDDSIIPLASDGATRSLQFHSFRRKTCLGIEIGSPVHTPLGKGTVRTVPTGKDITSNSVAIALDDWTLADGSTPLSYFGIDRNCLIDLTDPVALETYLERLHGIQSIFSIEAKEMLEDTRSFAFDASPVFVYATGRAVDGMLASNVADYLEFKTVEALLWLNATETPKFSRVPCSKSDVFSTTLLSPMDKRKLMKFLQLTMDYTTPMATTEQTTKEDCNQTFLKATEPASEDQVQSLNERHLNHGRSLPRPQNKAVATNELTTLQHWMEQPGITLEDYLSHHHRLSPNLRSIIRYALALETSEQPALLSAGMEQLRNHLHALGRYGTTAFLVLMYGSGELSQAFCRSAAVFGATYLLRRSPLGIVIQNDVNSASVKGVQLAGDSTDDENKQVTTSERQKVIRSTQVVVPTVALVQTKGSSTQVLRRISLLNGTLVSGEQRHAFILPPFSVADYAQSIHGISMDHSIKVAKPGCTMLHLTTTVTSSASDDLVDRHQILDQAAETILQANNATCTELYVVNFSYTLPDVDPAQFPKGVHLCSPCGHVLTADTAFEQAEGIFHQICPGEKFLGLSEKLDAYIRSQTVQRGCHDDDQLILQSALGLIDNHSSSKQSWR